MRLWGAARVRSARLVSTPVTAGDPHDYPMTRTPAWASEATRSTSPYIVGDSMLMVGVSAGAGLTL